MVSVGETIGGLTSGFSVGSFGGIVNVIAWFVTFLIVLGVIAWGTYYFVIGSKFNKKITVYENIAGSWRPTMYDKARVVKVGDGGEEVLHLKKLKLYRNSYGKKIAKNHYAFAIGEDGYWYNFTFGDFDAKRREMGLVPVDKDMRMMHVAIRRNIKDRFEKVTFLQKYGGLLAYTALIAVTGVMMFLLFDKFLDITSSVNSAIDAAGRVQEETARLIASLDVVTSSSGVKVVA